jgi:hypothetical protein
MKNIIIISTIISTIFAEGISGVSYFRYAMGSATDGEDHGFYIDRAYLTYKKDVSENVSFKFQSDIQNTGEAYYMYLKNAKIDYKVADNTKLTIGLQGMNMFSIQEKTWGHRFVAKSAMDANKWSSAADLGVGITQGFRDMSLSLLYTNGEGYKSTSSDDNEIFSMQVMYGERRLDKNKGFNVGFISSILRYTSIMDNGYDTEELDGHVMGVFGGFSGFGLRAGMEYNMGTHLDLSGYAENASLLSLYGTYNLSFIDGLSIFLKYDMLDADTETNDVEMSTLLAGLSYHCAEGIIFSPNITQTTVGTEDPTTAINLSFQLKF